MTRVTTHTVKMLSSDGSQLLLTISDLTCSMPFNALCYGNMFFISSPKAHSVKVFRENGVFFYSICNSPESDGGQVSFPVGLAVDRFNNLVVRDFHKARLQIFALDGKFVNIIEGQHTELREPYSVTASGTGQLFVTDIKKISVQVFL